MKGMVIIMKGDLHCHTMMSDGSLGIENIIIQAKKIGLDYISITDHDTISTASRANILGERYGVKVISGVELSAWDKEKNTKVHILCYLPKKPDRLEGLCIKSCAIRKQCALEMIEKVEKLYPITLENVLKHSCDSKSIFKQHILHALMEYGYTNHIYGKLNTKLFNSKTGTCIVEREYPDVNFVLDLIHSARGIAVIAHPALYKNIELTRKLAELGKIDGIEVYHNSANKETRKELLEIAKQYNLIVTGGSDFHGIYNFNPTPLGCYTTDEENLNKILNF